MKRKALGKGLDALIPTPSGVGLRHLNLHQIRPNPYQPRAQFEPAKLEQLAQSIRSNGVIQPIVVRPVDNHFQLVAGERRWRAAERAGLSTIPALVHSLSNQKALELSLIENIQRADLSAIEEANAYRLLLEEFSLSQQAIAQRVGRSRSSVANTLRLLRLADSVQRLVIEGQLSGGHARALLPLPAKKQQVLAQQAIAQGWSVRQIERRVRALLQRQKGVARRVDPNVAAAARQLEVAWQTPVRIEKRRRGGQIIFHYASEEELEGLFNHLLQVAPS